jgi:diguanylate cyclase (GGDEF)-like protein/PAS domain S-box-containing protein
VTKQLINNITENLIHIAQVCPDGILVADLKGKIIIVNSSLQKMWSIAQDIFSNSDLKAITNHFSKKTKSSDFSLPENTRNSSTEIELKNGKIFTMFCFSLKNAKGKKTGTVWFFHDVTKQKQKEKKLAYDALHDPLTKLANRVLFNEALKISLARAKRTAKKMALLYLDIDNFKRINDSFGHDVGDAVLAKFGKRLQSTVREDDFVARIGGDEFAIIVNNLAKIEDIDCVVTRIKQKVNGKYNIKRQVISLKVSIGSSVYSDKCRNIPSLCKNADVALYVAKK